MAWRATLALMTLLVAAALACGSDEPSPAVGLLPAAEPTRTVAPLVVGARPEFPTETPVPEPTAAAVATAILPTPTAKPTATLMPTPTPTPIAVSVAPVAVEPDVKPTPEPCAPGVIGGTGISVVSESFFGSRTSKMPTFVPGLESDFYAAHNLRWLVWMLRFDIPENGSPVELGYRWGQALEGGDLNVMASEQWEPLQPGGASIRAAGLGGDTPGFWRPGRYFVDAWSPEHDCQVASWLFEVH